MIAVIDVGTCNLGSVRNMLRRIGAEVSITADASDLARADKYILPGVGAFDHGMRGLQALRPVLEDCVLGEGRPLLGICLGMQMMAGASEEGLEPGLGWIPGQVERFRQGNEAARLKVPHMGWNALHPERAHPLLAGLEEGARFYFVHSFHFVCEDSSDVLARSSYGGSFASVIQRENLMATQFHPEKSHRFGMRLLRNFIGLKA